MYKQLGSMPFSEQYLAEETVGHWAIEKDPGKDPRMYVDDVMLGLIGLKEQTDPEDTFRAWLAGIDANYMDSVLETERMNTAGIRAEVQYPWHYPDGHTILIRCEGIRNYAYKGGVRTEGRHRDITNLISLQKEAAVIEALAQDFECVSYVLLQEDKLRDVTLPFRTSERMKELIPGWEVEKNFHNMLELVIKYVGAGEEDIADFRAKTRRETVLEALKNESAYYVNTRASVNGNTEYYQWKFTADRDVYGKLVGIVVGIHGIDDEMRRELETRERIVDLVEERTKELRKKNEALSKVNNRIIEMVGNIVEGRDAESGAHINRVKQLTRSLALQVMKELPEYGLTVGDVSDIVNMSPLHDVGKIMIPDSVLLKRGKLTAEEFAIMKTHCEKGCRLLEDMADDWGPKLARLSRDICLYHHEKWDGKGYPYGLVGDEIPIAAQIVSIADVYDALVSERCYKHAYSHDEACRMILAGECGAYSDKLLRCFEKCRDAFRDSAAYAASGPEEGVQLSSMGGEYILESVPFLEKILGSIPGGFFIYQADADEKFIYFNDTMVEYLGCSSREEFIELTGNSFKGLVHPEDYEYIESDIASQIRTNNNMDHVVYRTLKKDGSIRWLDDYGRFISSEDMGDVFFVFVNDFTEAYTRRDARLSEKKPGTAEQEDTFRGVLKGLRTMVVDDSDIARSIHRELLEEEGAIVVEASDGLEAVNLIRESMDYDLIIMDLVMPVMSGVSAVREINKLLAAADRNITIICLTAEGSDMQIKQALDAGAYECMYKPLNIPELSALFIAAIRQNTARIERRLEEARKKANTDALTHVKNIVAFTDRTSSLAARIKANEDIRFGIVVCDCDDLKFVNDTYGHDVGDRYICNASASICETFKHSPVFRMGGDEFVVILEGVDLESVDRLLPELRKKSKCCRDLADIEKGLASFSLGTAFFDRRFDGTVGEVIKRADMEMYKNKLSK